MSDLADVLTAIIVVAGIMVMVRSGSQGPQLVSSLGQAFSGALGVATGSTYAAAT
jgi:hypothetical protein